MLQVPTDAGAIEQARFCCNALWSLLPQNLARRADQSDAIGLV
jgi:hypothetical protein